MKNKPFNEFYPIPDSIPGKQKKEKDAIMIDTDEKDFAPTGKSKEFFELADKQTRK